MKTLIENGNIVPATTPESMRFCSDSGYFIYNQRITFLRKYTTRYPRFYTMDSEHLLYTRPGSKKKNPEISVDVRDEITEGKEYYAMVRGVSKKRDYLPLSIFQSEDCVECGIVYLSKEIYDILANSTWYKKPTICPLRYFSTSKNILSEPGEFFLLYKPCIQREKRGRGWPNYDDYMHIERVPLEVCPYAPSLVIERKFLSDISSNVITIEGFNYDKCYRSDYLYDLHTIKQMLRVDPDLVFTPIYVTDDRDSLVEYFENVMKKDTSGRELDKALYEASLYRVNYAKKWGKNLTEENLRDLNQDLQFWARSMKKL